MKLKIKTLEYDIDRIASTISNVRGSDKEAIDIQLEAYDGSIKTVNTAIKEVFEGTLVVEDGELAKDYTGFEFESITQMIDKGNGIITTLRFTEKA